MIIDEVWSTARTRVTDVRLEDVLELTDVIASASDISELDPTFRPVDAKEIADLVTLSLARGRSGFFQMQAIRLTNEPAIVGYWHCRLVPDVSGVVGLSIFVLRPEYRGAGYGSEVVERLLQLLRENPALRAAWARVYLRHIDALRFWTRHGFTHVAERKGSHVHVDDGHASVILENSFARGEAG
jgi:RimJ/RimL family protein N-acetyltransferase